MSRGLAQKNRVQKKLEEPLYRAKTGFVAGDLADFQSVRDSFCQKDQVKSLFEEHDLYRRNSAKLGLDLVPAQAFAEGSLCPSKGVTAR
jgi:hypothetical protein